MALWAQSQSLPADLLVQMRSIYGEHFPIEVRHFLAPWIEEIMWTGIDPDLLQNEHYVEQFATGLIQELEAKAASMDSADMFITKMKLVDTANLFKHRYASCPRTLYHLVRRCFNAELKLVQQVENVPLGGEIMPRSSSKPDAIFEITREIDELRKMTQETGEYLRQMEEDREAFALLYHECSKGHAHLQHLNSQPQTQQTLNMCKKIEEQKKQQERKLNQMAAGLMQLRLTFTEKLQSTVNMLTTLQTRVLDEELINWQREQQLAGNGSPFNTSLDNIQGWCENLAEVIWSNRQQIKELERLRQKLGLNPPTVGNLVPDLSSRLTQLLYSLVTRTFIIERQPPQVMKTNTKFMSTVRLLVGGKLNVHMTSPQVRVSIVSEAQANSLLKNDKIAKRDASGEIINSVATMEYHQATRQLSASFRSMQLKRIKRTEKKGSESVMDEKFSLLFQSQFTVGGGELVFQVWTLSLPVVVIVHGNQEAQAWATVTWDNAFAEPERIPFAVPENVVWKAVAEALNKKFRSATGRPLTDDNLRFLAEKVFRFLNCSDYSAMMLSWSQFCKEPLSERGFTFWEWFYAVMKLTREHLRDLWCNGLIHGFVQKKQAEEMLSSCANGTFLLRFSDSELGGVTIAWVEDGKVYMLQPFTSKDFAIRSLPDRIADLAHLVHLYPDISKNEAFGKYYTPREHQPTSNNGYLRPFLVTHVPGWGGPVQGSGLSYPNTPQPVYPPHSPESACPRDTPSVNSQHSDSANRNWSDETPWVDNSHAWLQEDMNRNNQGSDGVGLNFVDF